MHLEATVRVDIGTRKKVSQLPHPQVALLLHLASHALLGRLEAIDKASWQVVAPLSGLLATGRYEDLTTQIGDYCRYGSRRVEVVDKTALGAATTFDIIVDEGSSALGAEVKLR